MRNFILAGLLAFLAIALGQAPASAQGISRLCIQTVSPNGQNNCSDAWVPVAATALSTTVVQLKGSSGQLGLVLCANPNASTTFVQAFNAVPANVTLGTTASTPIAIPPSTTGGFSLPIPGLQFNTAISVAATTTAGGSTAPGTALVCTFGVM